MADWTRVSARHPCPVCRKPDWCTVGERVACCMRVRSDRAARNGGWIHDLADATQPRLWRPPPPPRPRPIADLDFAGMLAGWAENTHQTRTEALAARLGVSPWSLARLGAAWAPQHMAWAFPMRDGLGTVIGVRLRADDGRKWAVRGSRAGLIYEPGPQPAGPILVVEGPTDAAAALTAGWRAVGRPSCRGQDDLLRVLLGRWHGDLVIVADNDPPHARPDGAEWRPGLDGALDLARVLRKPCRVILPPCKDLREWTHLDGFAANIRQRIDDAKWLNVR